VSKVYVADCCQRQSAYRCRLKVYYYPVD